MDLKTLRKIATAGESEKIEFKKSTADLNGACESLCGMLNAGLHGRAVIGVANGKLFGQEISDRTQQEIAKALREFSPDPHIRFSLIEVSSNLFLILLEAKSNPDHLPYFYKGKAYLRSGTTTTLLSRDRIISFITEQKRKNHPYDSQIADEHSLKDLDTASIRRAFDLGVAANRLPSTSQTTPLELLRKFELVKDQQLTQAAVILFARRNIPFQCTLMMARFKGAEKGEFLDHREFRGNAFQMLEEGMLFLSRHLPLRGRVDKNSMRRSDEPLIPTEALREALLNAICHRDYEHPGSAIHLAIYDDRIEIVSPGCLMQGILTSDLKKPHRSILRNPRIAQIFYYSGLVEKWGQGTLKIAQACKQAHLPEPEFTDHPLWFSLVIRAPISASSFPAILHPEERREKILEILRLHKKLTLKEIHHILPSLSTRTIQRELRLLKDNSFVSLTGTGTSSTFWTLREE
jgi:ATP-dependent DNA helicase RecG